MSRRPFVAINMASTADGKITSSAREYPAFAGDADGARMDRLRARADAVMVGAGTLRADDPELHVRREEARISRAAAGKPPGLTHVVVLGRGTLDPEGRAFVRADPGRTIVATIDGRRDELADRFRDRAEIWECGDGRVDLARVLERLAGDGVESLLLEGGGELNWAMLDAGLVDELNLTLAPSLLGGRDAPTAVEGEGWPMSAQRRMTLATCERAGDELHLTYRIEHGS